MKSKAGLVKKVLGYKVQRIFDFPKILPVNLTLGVTYRCNSRCKTCNVWKFGPESKEEELSVDEYKKIFRSIGKNQVMWVTLSGGEPFLRQDVDDICEVIEQELSPGIINIPTNSLMPRILFKKVRSILKKISKNTQLVINFSVDGIEEDDNEIRGVPNAWKSFKKGWQKLKRIQEKHDNLELGIHAVVSVFNHDKIPRIYEYLNKNFEPDSFITEVAENRVELQTMNEEITPSPEDYTKVSEYLRGKIKENMKNMKGFSRITQAFRYEYYNIASKVLKEKRQVLPCFAGWASAQITPQGDVWPCCIRAVSYGNLRDHDYDFKKVWYSKKAEEDRKKIKNKECHCPLANAHYTNMLCNPKTMIKIIRNIFF